MKRLFFLSRWLRDLSDNKRGSRLAPRKQAPRRILTLETLEDRCLLSASVIGTAPTAIVASAQQSSAPAVVRTSTTNVSSSSIAQHSDVLTTNQNSASHASLDSVPQSNSVLPANHALTAPFENDSSTGGNHQTSGTVSPDLIVLPSAQHSRSPSGGTGPGGGFAPDQLRTAYGFPNLPNPTTGQRQTIAIVDAYGDVNILNDLNTFSTNFNLPTYVASSDNSSASTTSGATFHQVDQNNNTVALGTALVPSNTSWATEIALDVEWAHAIAPQANIVLVESPDTGNNMFTAAQTAGNLASVVSMSWGGSEWSGEKTSYDPYFNPATYSHPVTFVASSGDSGAPPIYPATSPYVVAVGGTSLTVSSTNTWSRETGWGNGNLSWLFGGSGGGYSKYELEPSYQQLTYTHYARPNGYRMSPDVAYDANPSTGVSVYDSTGSSGWVVVGGTSAGAPQWSALVALADQQRVAAGGAALNSTQTLTDLYTMAGTSYSTYFHDITSGNNGYSAGTGYDLVTGLGSPQAGNVISYLTNH